jgi:hypothetical protein
MSQGGRQDPGYGNGYGDEYAEDEDDYYTYDATDEDEEGRRPLVILAIIALIVVFAGVVFLAYKQGLKQGAQGNPPIIRADSNPVKVAPTNPGGIQIPHQDRSVYDRLSGSTDTTTQDTEHLLPTPEEPITMAAPETKTVVPATPSESTPAETPAPQTVVVQPAPVTPAKPVSEPVAVAAPAGAGGYVVQLAAFRDEPSARTAFAKLQSKFPALKPLGADIQRADLGAKGIYYRLRAGFLSKADATALCGDLATKGQACFVRPK